MAKFLRLFGNHVLVQIDKPAETTAGGIVLPASVKGAVAKGTVLMVGPGKRFIDRYVPIDLVVGDRVAFLTASIGMKQGQAVRYHLEDNQALVTESDVLFKILKEVEVSL